ncbi:MAG: hypothetical protein SGI91_24590 [Alphaproteobacteria bacterium]|nr:hypothetical protein [Alphaproteobacteria bacterium]
MTDWDDLERVWRSLPAKAAPAADELRRLARWRWLSTLVVWSEVATAIAGAAVGVWLLVQDDFVLGVATLAFVAAVSWSSWWARSLAPAKADDPVMLAVELAVRRARIGTRLAFAILWSVAASLVFVAVFVLLMDHAVPLGRSSLAILGVVLIWLAVWTGGTLFYLLRRIRDLARLEALKASLVQED